MNKSKRHDLTKIAKPQLSAREAIEDYFISKMQQDYIRKPPLEDTPGREGGLPRELGRRKMIDSEDLLTEARVRRQMLRQTLDSRWAELSHRQLMLRQCFVKFNRFVCENQEKTERASEKLADDTEALEVKSSQVDALHKELNAMKNVCNNMEMFIQEHTMYPNYLQSVVEEYTEYRQPSDILNRFEALTSAKNKLSLRQEADLGQLETACARLGTLAEDKELYIMGLHNKLAELRLRNVRANYKCRKWEMVMMRVKEATANKQTELFRVRDSLWALYQMICKQKGIEPSIKSDDYENQLVLVMRALSELRNIVQVSKEKSAKDMASDKAQSPQ